MKEELKGFIPYGERVLVEPFAKAEKKSLDFIAKQLSKGDDSGLKDLKQTDSGFILPDAEDEQEKNYGKNVGTIVVVGTGIKDRDTLRVGQKIKYRDGYPLDYKGKTYLLVHESHVDVLID